MSKSFVLINLNAATQGDDAIVASHCGKNGTNGGAEFDIPAHVPFHRAHLAQEVQTGTIEQSVDTAMSWYRVAAAQGDHDAERRLGDYYRLGIGVSKDSEEAKRWYDMAAASVRR